MRTALYALATLSLCLLAACQTDNPAARLAEIEERTAANHRALAVEVAGLPTRTRADITAYCVSVRGMRQTNPHLKPGDWCDTFDNRAGFAMAANIR